ncbi:hypothetical protein BY996DRAFT_1094336 [Phakopsora pachyrhizi]|nr:hypothetical protein BY996DRAFT_1094336 [Phakopsora pachyrhizi]
MVEGHSFKLLLWLSLRLCWVIAFDEPSSFSARLPSLNFAEHPEKLVAKTISLQNKGSDLQESSHETSTSFNVQFRSKGKVASQIKNNPKVLVKKTGARKTSVETLTNLPGRKWLLKDSNHVKWYAIGEETLRSDIAAIERRVGEEDYQDFIKEFNIKLNVIQNTAPEKLMNFFKKSRSSNDITGESKDKAPISKTGSNFVPGDTLAKTTITLKEKIFLINLNFRQFPTNQVEDFSERLIAKFSSKNFPNPAILTIGRKPKNYLDQVGSRFRNKAYLISQLAYFMINTLRKYSNSFLNFKQSSINDDVNFFRNFWGFVSVNFYRLDKVKAEPKQKYSSNEDIFHPSAIKKYDISHNLIMIQKFFDEGNVSRRLCAHAFRILPYYLIKNLEPKSWEIVLSSKNGSLKSGIIKFILEANVNEYSNSLKGKKIIEKNPNKEFLIIDSSAL